jgi:hypothetical protein
VTFDGEGNPLIWVDGCPNCGKGEGGVDPTTFGGSFGPQVCSRRCELQLEYAKSIGRRVEA